MKTYHKPFENTIELDITIPYDAEIEVRFFDLSGKMVKQKSPDKVTSGSNLLELQIHELVTKVHIMVIDTGQEVIRTKVYFPK